MLMFGIVLKPQQAPSERLDLLFQYIVAIASAAEDFRARELGPIHLLKYAYLADLSYAASNEGRTYTGTDWGFHHFGPWSSAALERIDPSLAAIGATTKHIKSKYAEDLTRYVLGDVDGDALRAQLEEPLPFTVSQSISRALHEYGSDTESLLRHVYLTPPMLAAKPGDVLDFSTAVRRSSPVSEPDSFQHSKQSRQDRKAHAIRLAEARAKIAEQLAAGPKRRVTPTPAPRFDEVFLQGIAQLDASSGGLEQSEGTLEFHESVWTSEQRRGGDIP